MGFFTVEGGRRLSGEMTVQGSKNGVLPLLAASALVRGETVLRNCPHLTDVSAASDILTYTGCAVSFSEGVMTVDSISACEYVINDSLMHKMRSSIVFLGALLGRFGKAELTSPGGCEIGLRPIDLHLEAMRAMGTAIEESAGRLRCTCPDGLRGADVSLSFPSVGATENILLAAATARGTTRIVNAAREPEITELANFLNLCGAKICGAGESIVEIKGVPVLHGCEYTVCQDRIAAATYMSACAVTGGSIFLRNVDAGSLLPVIAAFEKTGCTVRRDSRGLSLKAPKHLNAFGLIRTMPYPGFPTDSQAAFAAMAAAADGTSLIIENIFENRFKYIGELIKMGANIRTENRIAIVQGVKCLHGAKTASPDLRGGSALVIAALGAEGESTVSETCHIDRGYESFEKHLNALGAKIVRGA